MNENFLTQQEKIEAWFQSQWIKSPAPIYGSVDLRNAKFKIAPVDMNLFPAGFNNLNPDFLPLAIESAREAFVTALPSVKRILLIPENHTRNVFYWENIKVLVKILTGAGFEARVGALSEIVKSENNKICVSDFIPDVILLNNDLSDGIPDILQHVDQPLLPPASLGWSQRLKSEHFQFYAEVCQEFSEVMKMDPWLISPLFLHCGKIDFMRREGEDCLASHVEKLLAAIQEKYTEYGVTCKPYVVIKADAGTYGMAVMMVKSVDEVRGMNRKQRTSMSRSKGGQPVNRVIVQEGVYTSDTGVIENAVAEPVVYLWGSRVAGGFYRVHNDRGVDENLNTPGMHFEPLAQEQFYAYGVIARLSMLAAAREMLVVT